LYILPSLRLPSIVNTFLDRQHISIVNTMRVPPSCRSATRLNNDAVAHAPQVLPNGKSRKALPHCKQMKEFYNTVKQIRSRLRDADSQARDGMERSWTSCRIARMYSIATAIRLMGDTDRPPREAWREPCRRKRADVIIVEAVRSASMRRRVRHDECERQQQSDIAPFKPCEVSVDAVHNHKMLTSKRESRHRKAPGP
jgi:hypothetical protein